MKRALLLIGDGMDDRPNATLGGKTPLQAAHTPNMDRLATEGVNGICDVVATGVRNGSDTGHLAILGYDPFEVYTGRGPFEALGIGMEVAHGDIAFRCNFSTVGTGQVVLDRRAGRISEGTTELAAAVNGMEIEDVKCFVKESVAHRCALVLHGPGLSAKVSDVDPHEEGQPLRECHALDDTPEAEKTARIVNEFVSRSVDTLSKNPINEARAAKGLPLANSIVPRGAGQAPRLEPFNSRNGVNSACVTETGLINGIGKYVGMEPYEAPGATGGTDSDLNSMADTILRVLENHNFVLCNVKGPDLAGHDNEPEEKVRQIEKLDAMIGRLLATAPADLYIALMADHATPCAVGDHSGDPVAITVWGPGVRVDDITRHDEIECAYGGMNRIRGMGIVPTLTQFIETQEKFGA